MDKTELRNLLDEIATERLTVDYKISEHSKSYELHWIEDEMERSIITRHTDGRVSVETSTFYDDHTSNERLWKKDDVAEINHSYPSVISAAIQTAITQVQTIEQQDLEVIDRLPSQ